MRVRPPRQSRTHVGRDGRRPHTRLRRQKSKNLICRLVHRRPLVELGLDAGQGLDHCPRFKRLRQEFADPRPHGLAQHRRIQFLVETHDLQGTALHLQNRDDFQTLLQIPEVQKQNVSRQRPHRADQFDAARVMVERAGNFHVPAGFERRREFLPDLHVRRNEDAAIHQSRAPLLLKNRIGGDRQAHPRKSPRRILRCSA